MMKVFDTLHDRYRALCLAGCGMGEKFDALVAKYQADWDAGCSWCHDNAMDMFMLEMDKRTEDSEQEVTACINELASKLKDMVLSDWAKKYSHDQMQALLDMLTSVDYNGSLNVYGVEVQYHEIVRAWNHSHAADAPVYINSGIEI